MTQEKLLDPSKSAKKSALRAVLEDETGLRLDRWFKRHYPGLGHGQLQKWLRTGQIRVDGKRVDSSDRLEAGQEVRLPPQLSEDTSFAKPLGSAGRPMRNADKLKDLILYEDDDVVAINKPAGLAVQGGTGLKENLDDSLMALSKDGKTRPKLVHRLDRETSGVLLIARNDFAAMKLAASFRSRTTQKIYWAAVIGVPKIERGKIDAPLIKRGQIMKVADADEEEDDEVKSALSLYTVVERGGRKIAFVALWPLTGRTHQLRVHMQHNGHPIVGDKLYGGQEASDLPLAEMGKGLHLHARRLIIPHPRRGVIDVTAPLGPHMKKTWKHFGFDEKADVTFDDM